MYYGTGKWLDTLLFKLEKRFGKHTIRNLTEYVIGGMAIVFVMEYMLSYKAGIDLRDLLAFDRAAVLSGQVWRVLSFIFLPPDLSIIFIIFALYFFWLVGSSLERAWGSFRFGIFYILGIIGSLVSGFITGYTTNLYLNMSMFLAFAALFPDFEIILFFILPVKVKWLAWADAAFLAYIFIKGGWSIKAVIAAAFINIAVFFGRDLIKKIYYFIRRVIYKIKIKK